MLENKQHFKEIKFLYFLHKRKYIFKVFNYLNVYDFPHG